jgi:hypothetical protein
MAHFIVKHLGHIFNPLDHDLPLNCKEFAQSPQTIVFDDRVRIYFSTRAVDPRNNKFLSHIVYLDFDLDLKTVLGISDKQVIPLGELGCFDEHGIFPINPLRVKDKIYAYTCGWSRRVSVSVETSTGLAISHDGGETFQKVGMGPVLSSSLKEPALVGDSFVQFYNDQFYMWYIFGTKWIPATENEPPARVYKIAQASSSDGINWKKNEGEKIVADFLNENECQALPTVTKIGNRYHMFFCYRYATDFRKNTKRGYRLGYAYSDDLENWNRDDSLSGFKISDQEWDKDMQAYPHIFQANGNVYLLYNGNLFGKYGFGAVQLIPNEG